ncbi:MAG: divalent-cation tolerance protein CutA [Ruminococcus flavefaciens]|nr:divalent-cation tolerance protein CutA [Ruminococcus flavefaciens]
MNCYCIVLTTLENEKDAQKIINAVLESRLAACIQTTNIRSHYTWNDEVCHEQEVLVMFKTSWKLYDALEEKIKKFHPYDTPEIIAVDIEKGFKGYLDWIDDVTE